MPYEDEEQRRSRLVIEMPDARRETERTQTFRHAPERSGYSIGVVAAVALVAVALTAIIFLFLMNRGDKTSATNVNAQLPVPAATVPTPFAATPQAPIVAATPFVVPSVPTTATPPAVVIPSATPTPAPTPQVDDTTLQANVSRKILGDSELLNTDVESTVTNGKVTLRGAVKTPDLKRRAERLVRAIAGVKTVDNQIKVQDANPTPATPAASPTATP